MKALELFCGIGGFAAAIRASNLRVVAAIDQSEKALEVYRLNFPGHPAKALDLSRIDSDVLLGLQADLWWLSPPCQPYTVKGTARDLADPRAASLIRLVDLLDASRPDALPRHLALENVAGFATSQARHRLCATLRRQGYRLRELRLCPTELGIPSRRPRYYLVATRDDLADIRTPDRRKPTPLGHYLDQSADPRLQLDPVQVGRFGEGLRILDGNDPETYTTCFTSSYGRELMHSGSYLREAGGVRRFSPDEIARMLHFPADFRFPDQLPLRKRWQLVGNSLSVAAVREVLRHFPESDAGRKEVQDS